MIHEPRDLFYDTLMEGPHKLASPHPLEKYFLQQSTRIEEELKLYLNAQAYVQVSRRKQQQTQPLDHQLQTSLFSLLFCCSLLLILFVAFFSVLSFLSSLFAFSSCCSLLFSFSSSLLSFVVRLPTLPLFLSLPL